MKITQDDDARAPPSSTSNQPDDAAGGSAHGPPMEIDEALARAWSLAESKPTFWREAIWPLIFRIETSRQSGEVDVEAEGKLLRIAGDLCIFT